MLKQLWTTKSWAMLTIVVCSALVVTAEHYPATQAQPAARTARPEPQPNTQTVFVEGKGFTAYIYQPPRNYKLKIPVQYWPGPPNPPLDYRPGSVQPASVRITGVKAGDFIKAHAEIGVEGVKSGAVVGGCIGLDWMNPSNPRAESLGRESLTNPALRWTGEDITSNHTAASEVRPYYMWQQSMEWVAPQDGDYLCHAHIYAGTGAGKERDAYTMLNYGMPLVRLYAEHWHR
jgi:hypothetical protein